jgi:hypothetical protein
MIDSTAPSSASDALGGGSNRDDRIRFPVAGERDDRPTEQVRA